MRQSIVMTTLTIWTDASVGAAEANRKGSTCLRQMRQNLKSVRSPSKLSGSKDGVDEDKRASSGVGRSFQGRLYALCPPVDELKKGHVCPFSIPTLLKGSTRFGQRNSPCCHEQRRSQISEGIGV